MKQSPLYVYVAIAGLLIASVFVFLNSIKPVYAQAQEYTFGPTINLSNNTGGWPLLAVSENNVYVVWHGGTDGAIVRASNDNGASFADPLKLKMTVRYIAASGNNVYALGASGFDMNTMRIGKITFRASNDNGASFEPQIDLARGGNIVNLGIIEDPVIAVSANNVYAIWIETTHESWDIFFRASNDNGTSFGDSINLSNSIGMSSYPKIAASGKDVYVVWSEDTDLEGSTDEIFFRASNNGGATFGDVIKLSNDSPFSSYPRIAASGNNVYVVWQDTHKDENDVWERGIFFSASNDGGATFGDVISLTEGERSIRGVQIAADGNNVYVAWNDGSAVFFRASKDKGFGFGDSIKLSERAGLGGLQWQPKMAVSGSNVYVLWTDQEEIFFRASNDNGRTFRDILGLSSEGGSGPKNAIGLAASGNNVYAVWLDFATEQHEILFRASLPYAFAGTVSERGCKKIGGTMVKDWIDTKHTQQGELCKYNDEYFRIRDLEGLSCEDEVKWAKDPKTQRVLEFGQPCHVPSTWIVCGQGPGVLARSEDEIILNLITDCDKNFAISIAGSVDYPNMQFDKERKRLIVVLRTKQFTPVNITLPRELLDGPYSIKMTQQHHVGKIKGEWAVNQNSTHASFFRELKQDITTIEITGSIAIPEFPSKEIVITEVELSSANDTQWIEVYNPTDHEISLATMFINATDGTTIQILGGMSGLLPKHYQLVQWQIDEIFPEWSNVNNTITIYPYDPSTKIEGVEIPLWDKTPSLTDTFADSRTWQLNGTEWTFVEETPMRPIPEFPFVLIALATALGGFIAIARYRLR